LARIYHWNSATAHAVRLIDAQDEYFPPERIAVSFEAGVYAVPDSLQLGGAALIATIEQYARSVGYPLFDGPCIRLVDYRASPRDSSESKHLELTLGKITWYDYVLANQRFGDPELARLVANDCRVTDFIDFDELARERSLRSSSLSNILPTYVTATTADGFLVYSQRTGRVASYRHFLMSAVSEKLHPEKDAFFAPQPAESLFLAAARGVREELSPKLVPKNPAGEIYLLGLEFHMDGYHPGLLFYLPLSASRAEVERACRESPGTDFQECQLLFVHLNNASDVEIALRKPSWFSAGKASMIRTLEFLSCRGIHGGVSMAQVAAELAH
jgi:hypothetical protein